MSNRTTFRLPGHDLHPLAERKCLLSLLAAYSRQWNPRNLEYPWYEPWAQILGALVAEHPSLSVAPQPYLWYDVTSRSSRVHTTPGPRHHMSTRDEELDELMDDVGNTTLESIRSTSVPSHRDRSRIPDFAISRKVSFPRPNNTSYLSQLARKVTYVGFPLLAELKASGARSDDIHKSLFNARKPMSFARDSLMKQAFHLFQMYPHQDLVILVAITGFWWSYRVYSRTLAEGNSDADDEDAAEDEEAAEVEDVAESCEVIDSSLGENKIHSPFAQSPPDSDEMSAQALQEQLQTYGFALSNPEGTSADVRFHTVLCEDQLVLPRNGVWSDYLLYGTAP